MDIKIGDEVLQCIPRFISAKNLDEMEYNAKFAITL